MTNFRMGLSSKVGNNPFRSPVRTAALLDRELILVCSELDDCFPPVETQHILRLTSTIWESESTCFMLAYLNQFAQDLEIFPSMWMNSWEFLPAKK